MAPLAPATSTRIVPFVSWELRERRVSAQQLLVGVPTLIVCGLAVGVPRSPREKAEPTEDDNQWVPRMRGADERIRLGVRAREE